MSAQPTYRGLLTILEAAMEAGVGVEVILAELVAGKRRGYGRHRGLGNLEPIPPQHFAEPTTRLPPGVRYATDAEQQKAKAELEVLFAGRASPEEVGKWWNLEFGHLPPNVVGPDYVEQELDRHCFGYSPQLVDTWIEVKASIIYADAVPNWTDVRVDRMTDTSAAPNAPRVLRKRGRQTTKREQVAQQMRGAIAAGRMTRDQLAAVKEESLAMDYGVSRDTARKARDDVLEDH